MYCSKPETKLVYAAVINSTFYDKKSAVEFVVFSNFDLIKN